MKLTATDIVISVESKYVERMLSGEKRIELRRRPVRVAPGSRLWIYTKSPYAYIGAYAIIERVLNIAPRELWRKHKHAVGVTLDEFNQYFGGAETACAILIRDVQQVAPQLHLSELRSRLTRFHPPQFFRKLQEGSPELLLLRSRAVRQPHV